MLSSITVALIMVSLHSYRALTKTLLVMVVFMSNGLHEGLTKSLKCLGTLVREFYLISLFKVGKSSSILDL